MTKLLIKRFIKDYENTQNSDVRTAYGKFSSIVGIVCNAILFISKLIVEHCRRLFLSLPMR